MILKAFELHHSSFIAFTEPEGSQHEAAAHEVATTSQTKNEEVQTTVPILVRERTSPPQEPINIMPNNEHLDG